MFAIRETGLEGYLELRPKVMGDARGSFMKTFHAPVFEERGLAADFKEQFVTVSVRNVLRGLHFQVPPFAHSKLVYCVTGDVLDVAVDLRRGQPTYGQHRHLRLSAAEGNAAYLQEGLAHGFLVLSDSAVMVYNVTSVHSPEHDLGLRWNSCGIDWPVAEPIVSPRDRALPPREAFRSPFR